MIQYTYSSDIILSELLYLASNLVWKNPKLASDGERGDTSIEVEQYNLARQGRLTFDTVYSFNEETLAKAGVPADLISSCMDDAYVIPNQYRDTVTRLQQEYIVTHYDEQNNYYRMLAGLPDVEDTKFFYNTKYPSISGTPVPLHKLTQEQLDRLDNVGYLDEMIKKHPSKKYLSHLTDKRIDIYVARNSPDYGLLYIPYTDLTELSEAFRDQYEKCRYMVSTVYRIRNLASENTEYHGFIGMVILFATLNLLHQRVLDTDITRDFFDDESLRCVYDSYGVPFYSKIPLQYHKKIVKNINRLISFKGSTRCIYELFDIFGFSTVDIYEYYMLKQHRFKNGKPLFLRKEDGEYDYERMFEVKFAKCRLYDDPPSEVTKPANHVDYQALTDPDPYWIHDKRLVDLIYKTEYNFVDSKYLGILTMFDMMKIIYEGAFYIKLILDNREKLQKATIYYKNIRANCNIFDFIIYLCCIMARKNEVAGNIADYPHEIGKFLGFNFKEDMSVIRDNISKNDYLKNDKALLDMLASVDVNSLESITRVYSNIVRLRIYLTNKMHDVHDRDEYFAYYELYNMLMYSEYVDNIFTKSDGTKASTFEELLEDLNPLLYERFKDEEQYDLDTEISDLLYTMESSCSALKYIHLADDATTNALFEYIFKLIDFFKSAKADLTGYDLILSLAHNSENIMKLLAIIDHITEESEIHTIFDELTDLISYYTETKRLEDDFIEFVDSIPSREERELWADAILKLDDRLAFVSELVTKLASELTFVDDLSERYITSLRSDSFTMKDQVIVLQDRFVETIMHFIQDEFEMVDAFTGIVKYSSFNDILEDPTKRTNLKLRMKRRAAPVEDTATAHTLAFQVLVHSIMTDQRLSSESEKIVISLNDELKESHTDILLEILLHLQDLLTDITERHAFPEEDITYRVVLQHITTHILDKMGTVQFRDDVHVTTRDNHSFILELCDQFVDGLVHILFDDSLEFRDTLVDIREKASRQESVHLIDELGVSLRKDPRNSAMTLQDTLIVINEQRIEDTR